MEVDFDNGGLKISKALACGTRLGIVRVLATEVPSNKPRIYTNWLYETVVRTRKHKDWDLHELSSRLKVTPANICVAVKHLEDLKLVKCHKEPGEKGIRKVVELNINKLIIKME